MKTQKHKMEFSDRDIIQSFKKVKSRIKHTDAPEDFELHQIAINLPIKAAMLNLTWLRNRIVQLRKANKLK